MNFTNLTHALLAVACQLVVATALWIVGIDFTTACAMGGLLAACALVTALSIVL